MNVRKRSGKRQSRNLLGMTFGRWKVIAKSDPSKYGNSKWLCQCKCGSDPKSVLGYNLYNGISKSCGCLSREVTSRRSITHGHSPCREQHIPEYDVWRAMKGRCLNTRRLDYPRYGGRGITVCDRWRESFEAFLADMGPRPSADHQIERKNNDLGYSPENCIWTTRTRQARNRRDNSRFEYLGKMLCMAELLELSECKVGQTCLWKRLQKGWPVSLALATPPLARVSAASRGIVLNAHPR